MQETLKHKLHEYIRQNNPDVLLALEEKGRVTEYVIDKVNSINDLLVQLERENNPKYIIEEVCMDVLTKELKPSKYNYICSVLEEEFEFAYQQFKKSGILLPEVINIIAYCEAVFESLGFTEENEDNRQLRYTVAGTIDKYLSK